MAQESGVGYRAGVTGLIIAVPEAEPVVGRWRDELDPEAARGIPAHITVLFPFLDFTLIDDDVRVVLARIVARHTPFRVEFRECRRFHDVLYLAPFPDAGLLTLMHAVIGQWPETPPYGGQFADTVPHLTVAYSADPVLLDRAEADVARQLPFAAEIDAVRLVVHTGDGWREAHCFGLGIGDQA